MPWYVDTRLLFYRSDLLAEAGFPAPPATWGAWVEMLAAIKTRVGPTRYGVLLPLNEYQPLLAFAVEQDAPLLRDDDSRGNFRSDAFKRALKFYRDMFDLGFAPATAANQIANVWDEFARGYFTFYISGPWNIGEFARRLPERMQIRLDDGADARSNRPRRTWRVDRRRIEPRRFQRVPAQGGCVAARANICRGARSSCASTHSPATFRRGAQPGTMQPSPPMSTHAPSAISSSASSPRPRFLNGSASPPRCSTVAEQMVQDKSMTIDQAAAEIDRRADRILEKRRWMLARKERP